MLTLPRVVSTVASVSMGEHQARRTVATEVQTVVKRSIIIDGIPVYGFGRRGVQRRAGLAFVPLLPFFQDIPF